MPAETPTSSGGGSKSRRVLLVDDDTDALQVLSEQLARAGHAIRVAVDAHGAFSAIENFQPEVAIIDIGLPIINGYELARQIRERSTCRLIALSGYGAATAPSDTAVTSFDEHFVKPVDVAVLLRSIGRALPA